MRIFEQGRSGHASNTILPYLFITLNSTLPIGTCAGFVV